MLDALAISFTTEKRLFNNIAPEVGDADTMKKKKKEVQLFIYLNYFIFQTDICNLVQ